MLISLGLIPILAIFLIFKFDQIKGLVSSPTDTFRVIKNFVLFKARSKLLEWLGVGYAVDCEGAFKVNYYMNDLLYTVVVKKNRSRCIAHIYTAKTPEIADITHDLRYFMGPYGNFHGIPTTPKMLGLAHGVTISYKNLAEKIYYKIDDVIKTD